MARLVSRESSITEAIKNAMAVMAALARRCDVEVTIAEERGASDFAEDMYSNADLLRAGIECYDEEGFEEIADAVTDIQVTFKAYTTEHAGESLTYRQIAENAVLALSAVSSSLLKLAKTEEYQDMGVIEFLDMVRHVMDAADDCTFPERLR